MNEMQEKMNEIENLKNELRNQELTLERIEMERLELAQKLHENYEEMKSITKERNDLKELQESFEIEREKLKGYIKEIEVRVSYYPFLSSIKCFFKTEPIGKGGGNVRMMWL